MAGDLTTHVLDTALGRPAAGLAVDLHRIDGDRAVHLAAATTNADGRTATPMLSGADFAPGVYQLTFHAADYLRRAGHVLDDPPFLGDVVIRFGMASGHHHVPLLLSPHGYSTYRGS